MRSENAQVELRRYQRRFVDAFFEVGAGSLFGLISPPGYGKGVAVIEVVRRVLEEGAVSRVLLLGPRRLSEQHHYMLCKRGIPCFRLDRFSLRALLDLGGCDSALRKSGVVVSSYEFLRMPDVVGELRRLQWALIVADEAQRLAGEATGSAFRQILRASSRGLLVSNSSAVPFAALSDERVQLIQWTEADAIADNGELPSCNRIAVRRLGFALTAEETAFASRCRSFEVTLIALGIDPTVAGRVSALARTGVPIADEILERWEHRGVPMVHGFDKGEDDANDDTLASDQGSSRMRLPLTQLLELRAIRGLAANAKVDSRVEELLGMVRRIGVDVGPEPKIVVIVEERSTAYYVASALSEFWDEVMVLHAGVELATSVNRMRIHGCGIVVATAAGLREGFDFPSTTFAVVYDGAASSIRERHLARFDRIGRKLPLTVVELHSTETPIAP